MTPDDFIRKWERSFLSNLKLQMAFDKYLKAVAKHAFSEQTEHTSRAALQALLEAAAVEFGPDGAIVLHEPKRVEGKGAPDFRISAVGMILGYVENKTVGENLDKVRKSAQIKKYLELSPNILLTDYLRFLWIKDGETQEAILATQSDLESSKFHLREDRAQDVEKLLQAFFSQAPEGVGRARTLAPELAKRCRLLRDFLTLELIRQQKEDEKGRLIGLYEVFRKNIFAELKLKEFADAFAQTLGYGLFLAKFNAPVGEKIDLFNVERFVPRTFELIRELVDFLKALDQDRYRDIRWVVEEILSLINGLDLAALQEDLSFRSRKLRRGVKAKDEEEARLFERDPYIYFYEDFLEAYDSSTREARGVYYTPPPVVNFIVRAIDDILVDTFGIKDGLADHNRVTVLDFACGTGTFLLEIFQRVFERLGPDSGKADAMVRQHLLRNIFGFEFLIAPYTIAHLKLSQYLEEKGHPLKDNERLQIFLTNTLEPIEPQYEAFLPALSAETEKAQEIKEKKILVITGNPPYSGVSRNMGAEAKKLIERYKYVDGKHFGERKHWLHDDYVKFIAFAQKKMDKVDRGIVGIITNHNYLDGPTFRGMRQDLMATFDDIYVLDLHGSVQRIENVPQGTKDQNVFDIKPGVAIVILIKNSEPVGSVKHAELWGLRFDKYKQLAESAFNETEWSQLDPSSPYYFFNQGPALNVIENFKSIDEIFIVGSTALQTSRDKFATAYSEAEILRRIAELINLENSDDDFRRLLKKKKGSALPKGDSSFWTLESARFELRERASVEVKPLLYRPFDTRFLIYDEAVVHRMKREVSDLMLQDNLALLVPRQLSSIEYRHVLVTDKIAEMCVVSSATKEQNRIFPVYYNNNGERTENLSTEFREWIDGRYDTHYEPEEILGTIYAVLYAQTYRETYGEFLRIDFPRIPFPEEATDFETLSALGSELIAAHLMREVPPRGLGAYKGKGNHEVKTRRFEPPQEGAATGKIWINDKQYFDDVLLAVWEFQIGGYQVLGKYLKDRKGRTLTLDEIENVENIVNVLDFTIEQMAAIDEAYGAAFPQESE